MSDTDELILVAERVMQAMIRNMVSKMECIKNTEVGVCGRE